MPELGLDGYEYPEAKRLRKTHVFAVSASLSFKSYF